MALLLLLCVWSGVLVVNTPGGNTISTAELTFSHMLALSRNIPQVGQAYLHMPCLCLIIAT